MPKKIQTIFKLQCVLLGILFVSMILFSVNFARADTSGTPSSPGPIFINEVMWQGASKSIADEWLELYNNSDQSVILDNYYLTDETSIGADGKPKVLIKICDSNQNTNCQYQIAPHGTFLISKNDKDFAYGGKESYLDVEPDIVDSHLVLSNTNLQIGLYDKSGNELDIFGGTDTNGDNLNDDFAPYKPDCLINLEEPATPENLGTYCSLQRLDTFSPGDLPDSWKNSSEEMILDPLIFSGGEKVFATPNASGRPIIKSLTLSQDKFPLGQDIKFNITYDVKDLNNDLAGFEIIDSALGSVAKYGPDETTVYLKASEDCPSVLIRFYDQVGLFSIKDLGISCYQLSSNIWISEVMPHPQDIDFNGDGLYDAKDEYVEIVNSGSTDVDLSGWYLKDKSGKRYVFQKITIDPLEYIVFYKSQSAISINDDGEELGLYSPVGDLMDAVAIPSSSSKDDISYSKWANKWFWTKSPTPKKENLIYEIGYKDSPSIEQLERAQNKEFAISGDVISSERSSFSLSYLGRQIDVSSDSSIMPQPGQKVSVVGTFGGGQFIKAKASKVLLTDSPGNADETLPINPESSVAPLVPTEFIEESVLSRTVKTSTRKKNIVSAILGANTTKGATDSLIISRYMIYLSGLFSFLLVILLYEFCCRE